MGLATATSLWNDAVAARTVYEALENSGPTYFDPAAGSYGSEIRHTIGTSRRHFRPSSMTASWRTGSRPLDSARTPAKAAVPLGCLIDVVVL
jgi:hypothetical protein